MSAKQRFENVMNDRILMSHQLLLMIKVEQSTIFVAHLKPQGRPNKLLGLTFYGSIIAATKMERTFNLALKEPSFTIITENRTIKAKSQIKLTLKPN